MKASIVTTVIGCFGVDEKNNIVHYIAFSNDSSKVAEKLSASKLGKIQEEIDLEKILKKKGFSDIRKSDNAFIQNNLRKLALEKKFAKTQVELNRFISRVNIETAKIDIKKSIGRDNIIVQVNGAIEELEKSSNILVERLREWYGLHFPEMDRIINSHEKYSEIVSKFGSRAKIDHPDLSHFRENSMGADLKPDDIKTLQGFSNNISSMYKLHRELSAYLETLLSETAPNVKAIAGPVLAAKLISLAGGLDRLAKMPSSTIQLLGAEKALFRHLHGRGKSPKHGVIIMHQYVQRAPLAKKGKIARLISSKLAIAAKMDFYSNDDRGKEMKKALDEKVKEILQQKKKK